MTDKGMNPVEMEAAIEAANANGYSYFVASIIEIAKARMARRMGEAGLKESEIDPAMTLRNFIGQVFPHADKLTLAQLGMVEEHCRERSQDGDATPLQRKLAAMTIDVIHSARGDIASGRAKIEPASRPQQERWRPRPISSFKAEADDAAGTGGAKVRVMGKHGGMTTRDADKLPEFRHQDDPEPVGVRTARAAQRQLDAQTREAELLARIEAFEDAWDAVIVAAEQQGITYGWTTLVDGWDNETCESLLEHIQVRTFDKKIEEARTSFDGAAKDGLTEETKALFDTLTEQFHQYYALAHPTSQMAKAG